MTVRSECARGCRSSSQGVPGRYAATEEPAGYRTVQRASCDPSEPHPPPPPPPPGQFAGHRRLSAAAPQIAVRTAVGRLRRQQQSQQTSAHEHPGGGRRLHRPAVRALALLRCRRLRHKRTTYHIKSLQKAFRRSASPFRAGAACVAGSTAMYVEDWDTFAEQSEALFRCASSSQERNTMRLAATPSQAGTIRMTAQGKPRQDALRAQVPALRREAGAQGHGRRRGALWCRCCCGACIKECR